MITLGEKARQIVLIYAARAAIWENTTYKGNFPASSFKSIRGIWRDFDCHPVTLRLIMEKNRKKSA